MMYTIHIYNFYRNFPLHTTLLHTTELFKIFFSLLTLSTAFLQKASGPGKNKPESDGKLILGSNENSNLCAPFPFVKNKLKSILLARQKAGDLLISVLINCAGFSFLCFYQNFMASHINSNL